MYKDSILQNAFGSVRTNVGAFERYVGRGPGREGGSVIFDQPRSTHVRLLRKQTTFGDSRPQIW